MSTALVTDSTAYLPPDLLEGLAVHVVPLHVVVGGTEHAEGVDIDPAAVASALRSFTPVSTSRPAPAAFLEAYRAAADAGADAVVSVHISGDMSSTIGGAAIAAEDSPVPVTIVDSRALGMAMGYAVLAGARLAAGGASAEEVADAVRATCASSTVVFYVDTLEYLRRGGRIGKAGALLGSALSIKPILGLRDGHIVPLERVRTSTRAIARHRGPRGRGRHGTAGAAPSVSTSPCTTSTRRSGPSGSPSDWPRGSATRRRCGSSSWGPSWGRTSGRARSPSPWSRGSCRRRRPECRCADRWCCSSWSRWRSSRSSASSSARSTRPHCWPGRSGTTCAARGRGTPGRPTPGRVLGRKWGALVLVLDVLKAYLPTLVVLRTMGTVPALVAGFAVVLGHVFSPFLRGRGGKGVACALGTVLAVEPVVGLGAVVVFALVKIVVPFVGEASVVTMGLVALVGLLAAFGWVPFVEPVVGVWLIALAVLVLWRHRRNILAWWKRRLR